MPSFTEAAPEWSSARSRRKPSSLGASSTTCRGLPGLPLSGRDAPPTLLHQSLYHEYATPGPLWSSYAPHHTTVNLATRGLEHYPCHPLWECTAKPELMIRQGLNSHDFGYHVSLQWLNSEGPLTRLSQGPVNQQLFLGMSFGLQPETARASDIRLSSMTLLVPNPAPSLGMESDFRSGTDDGV